ncbi:MAG TPA: hypothetical protein VFD01_17060 [Candidatus Dormibacteraeota bacterium]|nr:hypothetical protein [Candidatus Dormibacteraeota bacterium]
MNKTERNVLLIGGAAVVGLVIFAKLRSGGSASSTALTTPAQPPSPTAASDQAVGIGDLSSFEQAMAAEVASATNSILSALPLSSGQGTETPTTGTTGPTALSTPPPTAPANAPVAAKAAPLPYVNAKPGSPLPVLQPAPDAPGSPIETAPGGYSVIGAPAAAAIAAGDYTGPQIAVGGGTYTAIVNGQPTQIPLPVTTYGAAPAA